MPKFNFTIPEHFQEPGDLGLAPRREDLERWLADLPLANLGHAVDSLLDMLRRLNNARLNPSQRHVLLATLNTRVSEVGDALRDRFARTLLPLSGRARVQFEGACELHRQLAIGHKILATELLTNAPERSERMLAEAIYSCTRQLGFLLVEHYLVYAPEPDGIWRALHGLYALAEQRGLAEQSIRKSEHTSTVASSYKQAVLLALANPYHLMQEEAATVYRLLHKLAPGCDLEMDRPPGDSSCFLADLKTDSAPRFLPEGQRATASAPRFFVCKRLVNAIDRRVQELDDPDNETTRALSRLARHMQRDMLTRLRDSWGRSSEREHTRNTKLGVLTVAMGLSATHYFCTDGRPFTPELDEIRIHTGRTPKCGLNPELSLVPVDFEPWRAEEAETRLEAGINEPRRSDFDGESHALDVWEKIYATRGKKDGDVAESDGSLKPLYASTTWELKNESAGGLCLTYRAERSLPLKVGDIIGYRREAGSQSSWIVTTVRWLHVDEVGNMRMGIKQLAPNARGVATRAVVGAGKGGEYFRSLIAPDFALDGHEAALIAPATIYETGTVLAINVSGAIHYVQLEERLESSTSFSRFRFRIVPMPSSENKNINELRRIV